MQGGILVAGLQSVALAGTQRTFQWHFPLPFPKYKFSPKILKKFPERAAQTPLSRPQ